MNEVRSAQLQNIAHSSLLIYSTWLAVGAWLVYCGVVLILEAETGSARSLGYFFGLVRIAFGLNALRLARAMTNWAIGQNGTFFKVLAYIIMLVIAGIPLITLLFHAVGIATGHHVPHDVFQQNAATLLIVAAFYFLGTLYAGWRLERDNKNPNDLTGGGN
jgi:hypothetical protein